MKKLSAVLTATILVVALAGSAHASVILWTPPLVIDFNNQYVRCSVTNTTAINIVVSVQSFDGNGTSQERESNVTVTPRTTFSNVFSLAEVSVCKFTVPSAADVRANACLSNFGSTECLTEVDAR